HVRRRIDRHATHVDLVHRERPRPDRDALGGLPHGAEHGEVLAVPRRVAADQADTVDAVRAAITRLERIGSGELPAHLIGAVIRATGGGRNAADGEQTEQGAPHRAAYSTGGQKLAFRSANGVALWPLQSTTWVSGSV